MKHLLAALLIAISFNSMANIAFELEGQLELNKNNKDSIQAMITNDEGTFLITHFEEEKTNCVTGEYILVENMHPQNTFSVLEVNNCAPEYIDYSLPKNQIVNTCNKVFAPICGRPALEKCDDPRLCLQMPAEPMIYENLCDLKESKAQALPYEMCE
jgi:hypothetical protein